MNRVSVCLALAATILLASGAGLSQYRKNKSVSDYGINPEAAERVEVLYFPERVLVRAALTPEMLERQYEYKLEIREFSSSLQRPALITALRGTTVLPSSRSYDLRTAVLLYDKSGNRIGSLYFDRSGKNGVVNRESVSTDDAVYRWAKSMMRGFAD